MLGDESDEFVIVGPLPAPDGATDVLVAFRVSIAETSTDASPLQQ